ncbi:MAG: hypothetical protein HOG49_31770, partial [Candidatus Scalindua sp.]|nr:hypothetical protein [Candidatus Scalindua sp.]
MYKVLITLCIFSIVSSFQYNNIAECSDNQAPSAHTDSPDEMMGEVPQEEKSELALMMQDIDESYKAVEAMSGYYKYKKKQWKIILKAGENIAEVTKEVRLRFARPDDLRYEKQNELMQVEAEKMVEIAKNKGAEGALEEQQWQVRRLRQTCAICHKHLKIHIYPNLY